MHTPVGVNLLPYVGTDVCVRRFECVVATGPNEGRWIRNAQSSHWVAGFWPVCRCGTLGTFFR